MHTDRLVFAPSQPFYDTPLQQVNMNTCPPSPPLVNPSGDAPTQRGAVDKFKLWLTHVAFFGRL